MSPLGSIEFNIEQLPYELRIRYVRHAGWIERILAPAAAPALMAIGWFWQRPVMIVGAGGLAMLLIIRWAWGHESVLRVLPDRLVTSVYLWNPTETVLGTIESLYWFHPDLWEKHVGPTGLYVLCAGRGKCVLPLISEKQADAAIKAISIRFPNYPVKASIPVPD
ncbi:MAG TPA: hypothetical protein VME23_13015 [Terracidiphilus sp.]|nr:hypothetical protein [Terracidiphilus sp.]